LYVTDTTYYNIRRVTSEGVVTTFAGRKYEGAHPKDGKDGIGPDARFDYASNVVIGPDGTAFVIDGESVRKVARTGLVTTLPARVGSGAYPGGYRGFAVDSGGTLWVTSSHSNFNVRPPREYVLIQTITPDGVITAFGDSSGQPYSPGTTPPPPHAWGLAVSRDGTLYLGMSDTTIRTISPDRVATTLAGGGSGYADGVGAAAMFSFTGSIALDGRGNLYVADCGNHAVRKVTPTGVVTTLAGDAQSAGFADGVGAAAKFTCPYHIAVAASGTVYVTDGATVRRITPDGAVTTVVSTPPYYGQRLGPLPASLEYPGGLAVTEDGQLIITDRHAVLITRGL
jgi:sugar lactone lactonase YvrE